MTSTAIPARPAPTARRSIRSATLGTRVGWLLPLGVGRVVTWQLAILAVLATGFRITPLTVPVLALALVTVALTSVRIGGQCGYQWLVILFRYRRRRAAAGQQAPTAVHSLLPRLLVQTQPDRAGNPAGIAAVGADDGYTAVVQLAPAVHPAPEALVSALHQVLDRADYPVRDARLVVWATPASPRPIRLHWLAVRYRYADAPWAALARGGGADGGRRAAASAARRLVSDLAELGHPGTVLDTPELYRALSVAIGADPAPGNGGGYRPVESWRNWSAGQVRQACFLPRAEADRVALLGVCVPEAKFTATSYTLRRTDQGRIVASGAVRIGVPENPLGPTPQQAAATLGARRLMAADGRHEEYVLATLPLA